MKPCRCGLSIDSAATKCTHLETEIQALIMRAIGALPGVLCLRNANGKAQLRSGAWIAYGLGDGSPDLLCVIAGRAVGLEVKRPGEKPEPHQEREHAVWRLHGAFVAVVTSPAEALAAIERARAGESR